MDQQQPKRKQPSSSKVERKIVEKNRRKIMNDLHAQLNSLRPTHDPKATISRHAQVDEAIKYIKSLETKLKMAQEKKERLMERKRTLEDGSSRSASEAPKIEIHESGYALEVILTCGVDNNFIFCEIIRLLNEENIEVASVNSSRVRDSMMHVVHGKVGQSMFEFGGSKVSEKLKWIVNGSFSHVQIEPEWWGFGIPTSDDIWALLDPTLDIGLPPW